MKTLDDVLTDWTADDAEIMLEIRRRHAVSGHGSICDVGSGYANYFPFDSPAYPPQNIGSLTDQSWSGITSSTPASIVPANPFEPSRIRKGLRVWDAAIGIPASTSRPEKAVAPKALPCIRNVNETWASSIVPAMSRVGYVFGTGKFERAKGPFIVDLVSHPLGWHILEAAHALTHLACDMRGGSRSKAKTPGALNTYMQRAVAQLATCMVYGIPISPLAKSSPTSSFNYDDMTSCNMFGIKMAVSGRFRTPMVRIPVMSKGMLRPDADIAVVLAGVHTEPHPHGFATMSNKWKEVNRWACQPSMVVVAGWELVDVVCHQPIVANDWDSSPILEYGMHAADMHGPDTFGAYLRKAVEVRGIPDMSPGSGFSYVEDWVTGEECAKLIAETPPLPCRDCMRLNMQADGAPSKPMGRRPDPRRKPGDRVNAEVETAWRKWDSDFDQVFDLVEKATIYHEGRANGRTKTMKIRRARMRANKARLLARADVDKLRLDVERAKTNGHVAALQDLKLRLSAAEAGFETRFK